MELFLNYLCNAVYVDEIKVHGEMLQWTQKKEVKRRILFSLCCFFSTPTAATSVLTLFKSQAPTMPEATTTYTSYLFIIKSETE